VSVVFEGFLGKVLLRGFRPFFVTPVAFRLGGIKVPSIFGIRDPLDP
jgi:hypothetical protein